MNTNHFITDRFSNPDTERLFRSWSEERRTKIILSNQNCGACRCCLFLVDAPGEYEWLLCLQDASPYHLETLHWAFGCRHQLRDPEVKQALLPPFSPPEFPSDYEREDPYPGVDDE